MRLFFRRCIKSRRSSIAKQTIQETTVGEINIAGLPGVNVPAGYYRSGSPFSLIFVGSFVERGRSPGIRLCV